MAQFTPNIVFAKSKPGERGLNYKPVDVLSENDWILMDCGTETAIGDSSAYMQEIIPLRDFIGLKPQNLHDFVENTLTQSIGKKYVIASMLMTNNQHFVCAYQTPERTFRVINDLEPQLTSLTDYQCRNYGVAFILLIKVHDASELYLKLPILRPWDANRCLADACTTFFLRMPPSWWSQISIWCAMQEGYDCSTLFPFITMLLETHSSPTWTLTEERTVALQTLLLGENQSYGAMGTSNKCVQAFMRELSIMTKPPFSLNQFNVVMQTATGYITELVDIPSLILQNNAPLVKALRHSISHHYHDATHFTVT